MFGAGHLSHNALGRSFTPLWSRRFGVIGQSNVFDVGSHQWVWLRGSVQGEAMQETRVIELAIEQLVELAGGPTALVLPRGYPHLGLAILDATFSQRSHFAVEVKPLLRRYCDSVQGFGWHERSNGEGTLHGASALVSALQPLDQWERARLLSWQTVPGSDVRRTDAALHVAEVLLSYGIDTPDDLARGISLTGDLERDVRSIPGVGPSTWRTLLNLSATEQTKADVQITSWTRAILFNETISAHQAASRITCAVRHLQESGQTYSMRAVDYLIWRDASGREKVESPVTRPRL